MQVVDIYIIIIITCRSEDDRDGEDDVVIVRCRLGFIIISEVKQLLSSQAGPRGGPCKQHGACGSGTTEGSMMPRNNHGARCGR